MTNPKPVNELRWYLLIWCSCSTSKNSQIDILWLWIMYFNFNFILQLCCASFYTVHLKITSHKWSWIFSIWRNNNPVIFLIQDKSLDCNKSNMTEDTSGAGVLTLRSTWVYSRFWVVSIFLHRGPFPRMYISPTWNIKILNFM